MSPATPLRILTAVPICDGHDSAINTINLEFIRHGIEVIYLGYHRQAADIVRAAIQEGVSAIGLSSYNGGHVEFFGDVRRRLRAAGADHIGLFGGGGGTITEADAAEMLADGTDRIFFAGTPLQEMVDWVQTTYVASFPSIPLANPDLALACRLTEAAAHGSPLPMAAVAGPAKRARVVGVTGPGGAGKTTLIDELVLRFLKMRPAPSRVAILSHDPSMVGAGALLGDRATMIYSQDPRVFMHSMATRGQGGGLSPATGQCLEILAAGGEFELVFIETVGIGQEAMPFASGVVDCTALVMNPDYGARLQLQKIVMLDVAEIIAINKSDLRGAKTAEAEIARRLEQNRRGQRLVSTIANRHRDAGVDALYAQLIGR